VIPAPSRDRKQTIIPGKFIRQHLKERLMYPAVLQPGKAEAIPGIIQALPHRNIPLPTGPVQGILILRLPIPVAAVLPLLPDHTAHLPPGHPAVARQDPAVEVAADPGQAEVAEEAAVAVVRTAVVAVVHAEEGK
jgi:hypothetical protein